MSATFCGRPVADDRAVIAWRASVASQACAAGVDLINDTWAGRDPLPPELAAEFAANRRVLDMVASIKGDRSPARTVRVLV